MKLSKAQQESENNKLLLKIAKEMRSITKSTSGSDLLSCARIAIYYSGLYFEKGWEMQFNYEPDNIEDQGKLKELKIKEGLL